MCNQAYGAARAEDWSEAIDLLEKAIANCGSCEIAAGLHKDLGLDLCRNGDIDQGKAKLQKALALNPNDADAVRALRPARK